MISLGVPLGVKSADHADTYSPGTPDRTHVGVEPTVYGQPLLRRGLAAFDELNLGLRDIEFLADPARGEVSIGCPDAIAGAILAPLAWELCRDYPGITLTIASFPKPTMDVPELHSRELDIVLSRLSKPLDDDPHHADLNLEILFEDEVVIAAGANSRWAHRRELALADLHDASWIGASRETLTATATEQAFRGSGFPVPTMRVVSFSVQLRAHLLETGDFVCPMPQSMLRLNPECKGLTALPIRLPNASFPVVIVTLKGRTLPAAHKVLFDRLRAHVASLGLTASAPFTPPARPRSGRACAAPAARPDRNRRRAP